ncbi:predicted protein [Botrytis cinerea T4]|uniref:Uncharacterized protein n=1 Tax=Botryotinia fuckeliana (strain T4) TaxID=999810 RepID=G2YQY1_BOTF4|nr:predicted protein [Botrytis cinerea T4]
MILNRVVINCIKRVNLPGIHIHLVFPCALTSSSPRQEVLLVQAQSDRVTECRQSRSCRPTLTHKQQTPTPPLDLRPQTSDLRPQTSAPDTSTTRSFNPSVNP